MTQTTELFQVAGTKATDRAADIVFVHGLDGDKLATWHQEDDEQSFWPRLLYNDIPTCGVWSFGYDARSSEWIHGGTMPIFDRASNFAAFLRSEGLGAKPIFFIVHSLGGLVVKQLLRTRYDTDQNDPIVRQTKQIFFFATPHGGSDTSKLVQWLKFYRPSVLVKELESAAAPLRELNQWYRVNSPQLSIKTTVFYETRKTKGLMIVDQLSADPGLEKAELIPVDADHVEICKIDPNSMPYKIIRNAIESHVREQARTFELTQQSPLWMNVSCFNKYPDQWEEKSIPKEDSRILKYEARKSDTALVIEPRLPYLENVREGKPVWSVPFMWQPFRWLPLNLDCKFLNQGASTLFLTELTIRVRRSKANLEPVLLLKQDTRFPTLCLTNEGWGKIKKPSLQIVIHDACNKPTFPKELPLSVPVEEFDQFLDLDIAEQFTSLGVDIEAALNGSLNPNLGPFSSRAVHVFGELRFEVNDGTEHTFRFGTDMVIENPALGMFAPPTFEYQTKLDVDGEDYLRKVPISQVLKAGETDRFLLQLDVDRSSVHELSFSVESNAGTVANSGPLEISLFVPRSVNEHFIEPESNQPFTF